MISGWTRLSLAMTLPKSVFEQDDDAEDHRGGADDGGADEHRLGRGLEGVARAVALFEIMLGVLEVRLEAEVLLDVLLHVLAAFDLDSS